MRRARRTPSRRRPVARPNVWQPALLDGDPSESTFRLDAATRAAGLAGVKAAREALQRRDRAA
jgi:hypothetical protein